MEKVIKRISCWKAKILNFGGKVTLVKHVLQSIPIHTLAAISPPKTTLNYLKRLLLIFSGVLIMMGRNITGLPGILWLILLMKEA